MSRVDARRLSDAIIAAPRISRTNNRGGGRASVEGGGRWKGTRWEGGLSTPAAWQRKWREFFGKNKSIHKSWRHLLSSCATSVSEIVKLLDLGKCGILECNQVEHIKAAACLCRACLAWGDAPGGGGVAFPLYVKQHEKIPFLMRPH